MPDPDPDRPGRAAPVGVYSARKWWDGGDQGTADDGWSARFAGIGYPSAPPTRGALSGGALIVLILAFCAWVGSGLPRSTREDTVQLTVRWRFDATL